MKLRELLTQRKFSISINLEIQAIHVLIKEGILKAVTVDFGKKHYVIVQNPEDLKEGPHFIRCLKCGKGMLGLSGNHVKACSGKSFKDFIKEYPTQVTQSEMASSRRVQTDERKTKQSETLKNRFKTDQGLATKAVIGAASRAYYDKPGKRDNIARKTSERFKDPEVLLEVSARSREMWSRPGFRAKIKKYNEENRGAVLESAFNARKNARKTSNLHLAFKASLPADVKALFTTELTVEYYHVDEGNLAMRKAIEIDGCYWHGCNECGFKGVQNIVATDSRKTAYLINRAWKVLRIKECEIKKDRASCLEIATAFARDTHA
jgi:very-short-patch-repair endonuclease